MSRFPESISLTAALLGTMTLCLGLSYGLALLGAPQNVWLWCETFRLCEVRR